MPEYRGNNLRQTEEKQRWNTYFLQSFVCITPAHLFQCLGSTKLNGTTEPFLSQIQPMAALRTVTVSLPCGDPHHGGLKDLIPDPNSQASLDHTFAITRGNDWTSPH